jgi:hypothetical protein
MILGLSYTILSPVVRPALSTRYSLREEIITIPLL